MWIGTDGASTPLIFFDPANPQSPTYKLAQIGTDIFCSAHTFTQDGSLFIGGGYGGVGHSSPTATYFLDPNLIDAPPVLPPTAPFVAGPAALRERYYPSMIKLTNAYGGAYWLWGGTKYADIYPYCDIPPTNPPGPLNCSFVGIESSTGATAWQELIDPVFADQVIWDWYPRAFQLSSGLVFVPGDLHLPYQAEMSGSLEGGSWLIAPPGANLDVSAPIMGGEDRNYGNAVLMHQISPNGPLDRVLVFGGSEGCDPAFGPPGSMPCNGDLAVKSSVREFQPGIGFAGTWYPKTSMLCPRIWANAVMLPTGAIFIAGGSTIDKHNADLSASVSEIPIYHHELYDPGNGPGASGATAYTAPSRQVPGSFPAVYTPRLYHNIALLLPDASVLVAGGTQLCPMTTGYSEVSGEVYYPPYFFQGPRPVVTNYPGGSTFGALERVTVSIPGWPSTTLDRLVLLRPGSVTHHWDADQRYIELPFQYAGMVQGNPVFFVTMPASSLGPAGFYMLFAVINNGASRIPGAGVFIKLS